MAVFVLPGVLKASESEEVAVGDFEVVLLFRCLPVL